MTLYLLPNIIHPEASFDHTFVPAVKEIVSSLNGLIAESEKEAHRFLRRFLSHEEMANCPITLFNEHTKQSEIDLLLVPLMRGEKWGFISDAGLPCIADPGAPLIFSAREKGIGIITLPGPSSIIMALQLSGFTGQRFAFHGYLPREEDLLIQKLRHLEELVHRDNATQIWIEAPYRTQKMAECIIKTLSFKTCLCIAKNLESSHSSVITQTIAKWRKQSYSWEKEPALFLLGHIAQ